MNSSNSTTGSTDSTQWDASVHCFLNNSELHMTLIQCLIQYFDFKIFRYFSWCNPPPIFTSSFFERPDWLQTCQSISSVPPLLDRKSSICPNLHKYSITSRNCFYSIIMDLFFLCSERLNKTKCQN